MATRARGHLSCSGRELRVALEGVGMFSSWLLSILALAYLGCLFGIAFYGERRRIYPNQRRLRPFIYALALGVYCTSWTFFGAVGSAVRDGWGYIAIYLGPALVFLFALPVL